MYLGEDPLDEDRSNLECDVDILEEDNSTQTRTGLPFLQLI